MSDRLELCEALDHLPEDFEPMDTEVLDCVECGAVLDDDELLLGAFCNDCRPFHKPLITIHSRRSRGIEWVSWSLRHGYRGRA